MTRLPTAFIASGIYLIVLLGVVIALLVVTLLHLGWYLYVWRKDHARAAAVTWSPSRLISNNRRALLPRSTASAGSDGPPNGWTSKRNTGFSKRRSPWSSPPGATGSRKW